LLAREQVEALLAEAKKKHETASQVLADAMAKSDEMYPYGRGRLADELRV